MTIELYEDKELTLRDRFAMAALTGILSSIFSTDALRLGVTEQVFAKAAYEVADAMMEVRND